MQSFWEFHTTSTNFLEIKKKQSNLGRKDSNLRMAGPKPAALPLGDAPFMFMF